MYAVINFKSKKALKEAVKAGQQIEVFQPNADITGFATQRNGRVCLEGPHYPEPHKWYAEAIIANGIIQKVS